MSAEEEITIIPLRVGIRFKPPALVFVYEKKCGDIFLPGVLRRRIMPIRNFNESSNIDICSRELIERHGKKLFQKVPMQTVCKMLRLLREHEKGLDLKTALEIVEEEESRKKYDDDGVKSNRNAPLNSTFTVEQGEIKSSKFDTEKEESFEVDVEGGWDDDGDDSLDLHLTRSIKKDFLKDAEAEVQ